MRLLNSLVASAMLIAAPALAQQTPTGPVVPNTTGTSTLAVATVRLDNGWRASKVIGSAVYNDQNQKVGSVDDLILTPSDKVVVAVISVGGFLGIGSKLVVVPFDKLHFGTDNKVTMAGATKESLNAMPGFTYGS
ncbi:MAG: PRC-barrel domain-containing protein [Acidisphaera sp.]|nr:PRC-barrel domain-containing protein [Acidisphaera sp.]